MSRWKKVGRSRAKCGLWIRCRSPEGLVLIARRGACPVSPWFFPRHVRNRRVLHWGNNIFLEDHRKGVKGEKAVVFPSAFSSLTYMDSLCRPEISFYLSHPTPSGKPSKLTPKSFDHFRNSFLYTVYISTRWWQRRATVTFNNRMR